MIAKLTVIVGTVPPSLALHYRTPVILEPDWLDTALKKLVLLLQSYDDRLLIVKLVATAANKPRNDCCEPITLDRSGNN